MREGRARLRQLWVRNVCLVSCLCAFATVFLAGHHTQASELGPEAEPPSARWLHVGMGVDAGWLYSPAPSDAVGQVTLLAGSAFSGAGVRFSPHLAFRVAEWWRIRVEGGLTLNKTTGFSKGANSGEELRRTLHFSWTSLDLSAGPEWTTPESHPVTVRLALLLGGRFGLSSSADEELKGFTSNESPIAVHTHAVMPITFAFEVAPRLGPGRLTLGSRVVWAPNYPGTTEARLTNYASATAPGSYWVEAPIEWMGSLGWEW